MNYLYTGNKGAEFDYFWNQQYIKSEPLKVDEIADGVIVPMGYKVTAGVYDASRRFVPLAAERWVSQDTMPNDLNCDYMNEDVIYFASFSTGHYGDVLIDDLSRLWYILQHNSSTKLVYITNQSQDVAKQEWCLRILSYLGIPSDRLQSVNAPTRFKNVTIPQKSMVHDAYVHPAYLSLYECMSLNCSGLENKWEGVKRIYLTRTRLKRKKEIGEAIFE